MTTTLNHNTLTIQAETLGLDRLDVYVDGRPIESCEVTDGTQSFDISLPASAMLLELAGFDANEYVASRMLDL